MSGVDIPLVAFPWTGVDQWLWIAGPAFALGVFLAVVPGIIVWAIRRRRAIAAADPESIPIDEGGARDKALKESKCKLRLAQEIAGIGYWSLDAAQHTVTWSEEIHRLYGMASGAVPPTMETMMAALDPPDRRVFAAKLRDAVKAGARFSLEAGLTRSDGTRVQVRIAGRPLYGKDDQVAQIFGIVQDITASKRLAEEKTARRVAESMAEAKSAFLAQLGHELHTPMNAILGFTQLIKMEAANRLDHQHQEYLDDVMIAGQHLSNLVNDVLQLSRLDSGRLELNDDRVEAADVLGEAEASLCLSARQAGVNLTVHAEKGVPAMRADHTRLVQVLLNLISNALKYNESEGTVTAHASPGPAGFVRFTVSDTGPGIPEDQQAKLFQPFERLGMAESEVPGTGIGLVITKRLIEAMGGRIKFDSTPGEGTSVCVDMPVAAQQEAAEGVDVLPAAHLPAMPAQTFLYIADDPANLRFVDRILPHIGPFKLLSAHSAEAGLTLAQTHRPEVILMDMNMADLDGYEILARLKRDARTAHAPVIAFSAMGSPVPVTDGLADGFDAYLIKPLNMERFAALVREFTGPKPLGAAGSVMEEARCAS